ncbi:glycoside hydrolase family 5 protein [[Candida] arabinofermentans NRRL YB-2248]|uniref:glucan 1,3-beta-glucosidase n=1 Tax=[Candida] arabinofermentans NRRL YB-2248 TaxID=983967 RepID=A0A1E4SY99_9ASCO|nr:glycoside hydrolase family 5 protein [[Candida] arabinofermentans NRRL YB-2248]
MEFSPAYQRFQASKSMRKRDESSDQVSTSGIFNYSTEKVYGVNLGGWMVTEPYVTPSLYWAASPDGSEAKVPVDEYHYCELLGTQECHTRLKKHWETWIVEDDFKQIKKWGFNTVRFPIGYWAFAHLSTDPYCFGAEDYLEKAIEWSRKNGLKLWIDLHGAPGSQNGFDNSGLRDHLDWLETKAYTDLTLEIMYYIVEKYGGDEYFDVISGIQILNEPLGSSLNMKDLLTFYEKTYAQSRALGTTNNLIYHDAFMSAHYWDNRLSGDVSLETNFTIYRNTNNLTGNTDSTYYNGTYQNVIIDHHRYEVFDISQLSMTIEGHIQDLKTLITTFLNEKKPCVIGEWSAALTDCAFWLNGVGRGARYDGTFKATSKIGECTYSNDASKMTLKNKQETRHLIEAQLDLFNQTSGFIFWCYKTESAIEWDLTKLIELDLFPQPLNHRTFASVLSNEASIGQVSFNTKFIIKLELFVLILTIASTIFAIF